MNFKTLSVICLAATAVLATSSAMAWQSENGRHSITANVLLGSDYVFRGISQTDNTPAIQGGLDYQHASGAYLGNWASNVDFGSGDDASSEFNLYGGFASEFGETGIGYDLGALRYYYPGTGGSADFNEVYGSVSYRGFSFGIAHSGNFLNSAENGTYYHLGFEYGLPYEITLTAAIGYQNMDSDIGESYKDYLIAVSKTLAYLDFAITWTDTDSDGETFAGNDDLANNIFTFSVAKTF